MANMQNYFEKPGRVVVAGVLIVSFAVDAFDGDVGFDYDGPAKMIESLISSAPSSGPQLSPSYVVAEDTILGGTYEVIPPEEQYSGKQRPTLSAPSSLDGLLSQPTDVSSGHAILRDWTRYYST